MSAKISQSTGGPIAWMAQNSVAANLLMAIFLVGGLILSFQTKQEVFPEFSSDYIQISIPYPGASPEEVEKGVVLSVEDGVRGLDGVKRVYADITEGLGLVTVELLRSADISKTLQDVKNEVDRITSFPEDSERPIVSLLEIRKRVVSVLIYGDQSALALRGLAERVRDDLIQTEGITLVDLGLTPPLEISVEVSIETLRRYGLTLDSVANIIRSSAVELPGGEIKTVGGRILLRTTERRDYASQFKDIIVRANSDGSLLRLSDIAEISDGFEEADQEARFNGMPAVRVEVFRVGDETPQSVSKAVRTYLDKLRQELPESVGLKVWEDSSEIYQDRMQLLMKNAGLGLMLVLVLLGLFLEARLAFWVTLGIPVSIMGCFLFLPFTGASINMISLFAFIVTLGIIVDDAVVTGENIYEKQEKGLEPIDAAIVGAREISTPVVFAVLTNIAAFMPLFFVPGISGKFFSQIPSVVVAVFIVSLIESLFILPAHLAHIRQRKVRPGSISERLAGPRRRVTEALENFTEKGFGPLVRLFVKRRYLTLSVAISVLMIALSSVMGGHLRFSFLPVIEADVVTAQAELPFGVSLAESRRIELALYGAAKEVIREFGEQTSKGIYTQIGSPLASFGPGPSNASGGGTHLVAAQVALSSEKYRDFSAKEFAKQWRKQVGSVPGIKSLVFKFETGAGEGAALEYNLSHPDQKVLEAAASSLRDSIETYAGVFDTNDGVSGGKPQINFTVTPAARSLGITATELGRQLRSAFYGAEALRQQRGRNEIKVMVRLPEEERRDRATLNHFIVRSPDGREMPLFEAGDIIEGTSYTSISRRDARRIISVTGDVDQSIGNANEITAKVVSEHIPELQRRYPGLKYSFGGEQQDQKDSLGALAVGFALAMLAIFALLAVPFKSYFQPIVVMLSIPFGFIGAIAGHFLLGYGLSIISMFGMIALAGVVVNDSLVLVVTANRLRDAEGLSALEAVVRAAERRLRPILLTSLTTFFGLAPMIFESSLQARFLIPMAISLGFGILFATVIMLIITPAVYVILDDAIKLVRDWFDDGQPTEHAANGSATLYREGGGDAASG